MLNLVAKNLKLTSIANFIINLNRSSAFNLAPKRFLSSTSSSSSSQEVLKLSDSCIKRLKELEKANSKRYLRIIVDSGGCSGFEYKFALDTQIKEEDLVIEKENCKVLVDKQSIDFIKGSTIDYFEELIRSGFRISNNPNSEQNCSCGSSFSIKL